MTRAFLGLGSNVGDRLGNLQAAVHALDADPSIEIGRRSSVYETEAVGEVPDQRDFFNAVVEAGTDLSPLELLATCKRVERELGRTPGPRHGPRPIDVDVLMVGDLTLATERLVLPHPEVRRRRFVLVPLLEIEPALRLPDGTGLRECLDSLPAGQRVTRVAAF